MRETQILPPRTFFHWRWGPTSSANWRRGLTSALHGLGSAWPQALPGRSC